MSVTVLPDTEGALRTYLRAASALGGRRVEFGTPSGSAECIVLADVGSTFDLGAPVESALISFACFASYDPAARKAGTKAQARAIRDALVGVLMDLGTAGHVDIPTAEGPTVRLLAAVVTNAQWLPDLTTSPATPRYVVDALVHAIAVS